MPHNVNWIPIKFNDEDWFKKSFKDTNEKLPLAIIKDWKTEIPSEYREYDSTTFIWQFHPSVIEQVRKIMHRHDTDPNQTSLF